MRFRYVLPLALVLALGIASLAVASTRDHGKSKNQSQTQFTAFLNGHDETPAVHTNGTGTLTLTVNTNNTLSYTLTYSALNSAAAMAHVHFAQPNYPGGIVFFLCGGGGKPSCPAGGGTVSGTIASADIQALTSQGINAGDIGAVIQELRAGFMYANVHTATSPAGEIRGQLSSHGHGQGDEDDDD
jgi:hypothetical protein